MRALSKSAVRQWYRRLFSIHEIEQQTILQWVLGATVFSYFIAFQSWIYNTATAVDAYIENSFSCWPYFQSCGKLLFLRAQPDGYSQSLLYMALFGSLVLAVYFVFRKDWVTAHVSLMPSFVWHTLGTFVFTYELSGNYEYYLCILSLVLLFFPHKEFFLKLSLVSFYFLSTVAKIHESWIVGTYFSSIKIGLPLFPEWSIPFFTNLVIFMEMAGSWLLLSSRPPMQRTALTFFTAFHLYSGLLVGYRYPATVLPTLLILFGPMYRHTIPPWDKKSIAGWAMIGLLFAGQMLPIVIPGDEKLTLEGNKYGLYMFEANHQCIVRVEIYYRDGRVVPYERSSISARQRCDPYRIWFSLKEMCRRESTITRIAFTHDHSINGGPFLRIVDEHDACTLTYKPFTHNAWIKTHRDNPEIVGYPVENVYD